MRPLTLKSVSALVLGLVAILGTAGFAVAQGDLKATDRIFDKRAVREITPDNRDNKVVYDPTERFRVYRDGTYYKTDRRGADLLRQAITQGYRQGYAEGISDREKRKRSDWTRPDVYKKRNVWLRALRRPRAIPVLLSPGLSARLSGWLYRPQRLWLSGRHGPPGHGLSL